MPVSTDTLRNQDRLHFVFAMSAVVLLGATVWLVVADYSRQWRTHQREARVWQTAMTIDAGKRANNAQQQQELAQLEAQIEQLSAALPHNQIAQIEAKLHEAQQERDRRTLPAATVKGEIGPKIQQLERAKLAGSGDVEQIRQALGQLRKDYANREKQLVKLDQEIKGYQIQLAKLRTEEAEIQKQIGNLKRLGDSIQEKLKKINPQGLAQISHQVRNAPLLDWFNPTEKVQQVVVPQVRTDLNFLTVETIDRCNTCHINIDKPAFEENNLLLFVERQVASYEGQEIDSINHPVVLLGFWERAAAQAGLGGKLEELQGQALAWVNTVRGQAGLDALASADLLAQEWNRIAQHEAGNEQASRAAWYKPLGRYVVAIRQMLLDAVGDQAFKQLRGQYRQALIELYNGYRGQEGESLLSTNRVMLAHPRLDLYTHGESAHPMKTMGCTSCHEGSGQETDFDHAAHTPQDIWVDAQTGEPVPAFLLEPAQHGGAEPMHASIKPVAGHGLVGSWSLSLDGASVAFASLDGGHGSASDPHHARVDAGHARTSHQDIKLTDPGDPVPFAPHESLHGDAASYEALVSDGDGVRQTRRAIPQAKYWAKQYHWHAVHYMEWEKPMHQMRYIESSCNRCHTEVFDLEHAAPKLFEGRVLFAQLGCVNCHAAESLEDDLDIKKVGPSLVHTKHKLSGAMIASWIWSPRAFRPTSKMPHYFMLENNSSPVDILRTRTEVAAMTHYLLNTKPVSGSVAYNPEAVPEGMVGDAAAGKQLFNTLGCLACHSNLEEQGEAWIVDDLVARKGLEPDQASGAYEAMSYNQRHWYVQEHLPNKLERTGPELSGVGTKLLAGKDPDTAHVQATSWLYDWLRNPRHYSSYTIMPSFRLSDQEAVDLSAYLRTLQRPGYEAVDFLAMDGDAKHMLAELVANLKAAGSTIEMARAEVDGTPDKPGMETDQQLAFLGKKMIGNYGCNGCHLINGFEDAASACTNLDDWGLKDPHKLDFGYFDHAFDSHREQPTDVWKVAHEGLASDAPSVTHRHAKAQKVTLGWESMGALDRRAWLYHKLHNPRVYDRGRTAFDGHIGAGGGFDVDQADVGKPYDKLKMPKFFLTDDQVEALVTFVTSIRQPLVASELQQAAMDEVKMRVIRGRQVATLYNCYGCHSIEGNAPNIWQSFDVFNEDGSFNYEHLNNAPPRLIGQGSKTQPQWLFEFLHQVDPLRPWLKIRMPSFPLEADETTVLVDYFAGASQEMARGLSKWLEPIEAYRKGRPEDEAWFDSPSLASEVAHLRAFGLMADLVRPKHIDEHTTTPAERAAAWAGLLKAAKFTQELNDVAYPFTETPGAGDAIKDDPQWFDRGEALFSELKCHQCHAMGDEQKLLELWKLDNPDAGAFAADDADEGDGYDDEYDEDEYGEDEAGSDEEDYGYDDEDEGEDEGYGDEEEGEAVPTGPVYSGPNLALTGRRLQWRWVDYWLQEPATIQPGTKMPQWFPDQKSAFWRYPGQAKQQAHDKYGYSGEQQRQYLMGFMYEAAKRNHTPGAKRLRGVEPVEIEFEPVPLPPAKPETVGADGDQLDGSAGDDQGGDAAAGSTPEPVVQAPPPAPKEEPKVSSIQLHDSPTDAFEGGGQGRVVGVVSFEGKPPRRKPVRMGADAFCRKANKGKKVLNESTIVNKDGSMRSVFVYVKSGLSGSFAAPTQPAVIDQVDCIYRPHVLGVVAGQPVVILNSDNNLHNVKMNSANNGSFNEGMPVAGMRLDKVLSKPEMGISLKCDVHPWMGAVVHVMPHPFFTVSDVEGRFEITGLPPGSYTLEAVHENPKIPPVTVEVTVSGDSSHRVDVALSKP